MSNVKTETDKTALFALARRLGGIRVIYDVGALHALDGIELAQQLGAKELHTFECNPPSVEICRLNLARHLERSATRYYLCEAAVADSSGQIEFHPIDVKRTITPHAGGNPGASSLFEANGMYPKEKYVQTNLRVSSVSLDDYVRNRESPDLIWMDLQGAELLALQGGRHALRNTKLINLEVGFRAMYSGQAMFWEINTELKAQGFRLVHTDFGRWPPFTRLYSLLKWGPWVGNAVYCKGWA